MRNMKHATKNTLICDTECYSNLWSIGFTRIEDGRTVVMEKSHRRELDTEKLRNIMLQNRIITYNGRPYDWPMIWYAISGATNAQLKQANDQIILGGVKYWDAPKLLGIDYPRGDHIDLIEPQPNAFASLKTLSGRLHCKRMQDLPYSPDSVLTDAQIDHVLSYMGNDIANTGTLFDELREALAMREALSAEYRFDFRSSSDSQIGEGIIKKRVEQLTGEKAERVVTPAGTTFRYTVPAYLTFEKPDLQAVVERLRDTNFHVQGNGKVDLPDWIGRLKIGDTTYAMGIGGLHSTESNRSVHADADHFLRDYDVASFYPAIILGSGLYPKALGRHFLDVYRKIREDRIAAKRAGDKFVDQGLKIALNGVYGKLGSTYSILYAPHLMIAVTLTGQLALLMLIDRAERAGIPVVSANTDGVIFRCPRACEADLDAVTKQWEADTGFDLEATDYTSVYSLSVNTYIAVKPDGKTKRKGTLSNPWREKDSRGLLMKNPNAVICSDAVVELVTKGTPLEDTIRACTDIRDFVSVVNVKGGGTWRGDYLGKVVRYYWALGGEEILYKIPHATTGNFKKVPRTDGCRPLMDLPEEFPTDIDYDRYIDEAREMLMDIGYDNRPPPIKPIRLFRYNAAAYWALAV
ncbi:hypothetical protein U1872_06125 [Sphingomonas sp. RB3P16]|uniref:hypothetical protein n=1 Tax=Parasphingomonas frigoris TaxID=3096163 RepID=UPI002FCA578B